MHEPIVELLPSLAAVGAVGAHWLVRARAAVSTLGKADAEQDEDEAEADITSPKAEERELGRQTP